jgi:Domain of unknown function (DUF4386)
LSSCIANPSRTRLIPRFLAAWGLIGYVAPATGAVLQLLGVHVSPIPSIPGGLGEVTLGGWLQVKGFQPQADAAPPVGGGRAPRAPGRLTTHTNA